jgi:hypothetical protein
MAAKRDSKGRFIKGSSGKRSRSRSKRAAIVVSGARPPARRRAASAIVVPRRRRSSTGGGVGGGVAKYFGGVRGDDTMAAVVLGGITRSDTGKNYVAKLTEAVGPLGRIGAVGVIAVAAGLLNHSGVARRYTAPVARAASIIAAFKLTSRGELYADGKAGMAQLAGDDDDYTAGDVMDVGEVADDYAAGDDDE